MSISHTPGPWVVIDQRDIDRGWWIGVDHPEWGVITHAEVRAGCDEADELGSMEANARLIAASPILLAAVIQYRDDLRHPIDEGSRQRRLAKIDAAISKATSRQPEGER